MVHMFDYKDLNRHRNAQSLYHDYLRPDVERTHWLRKYLLNLVMRATDVPGRAESEHLFVIVGIFLGPLCNETSKTCGHLIPAITR